LKYLCI